METGTDFVRPVIIEKRIIWKKELPICLLLSIIFGVYVTSASEKMNNRQDYRSEMVQMERDILHGRPFTIGGITIRMVPWQNRVMFPALLELCIRLGIFTANGWYLLLRFSTCILMFAVFWFLLRADAGAELKIAGAGMLYLAYGFVITFVSRYSMSFEFPEAMFMAIFIAAALRRKFLLLFIVCIVASANRESSAFAGVYWFFLYGLDELRKVNRRKINLAGLFPAFREVGYAALISICSYGSALLLRYVFGGKQAIGSRTQAITVLVNYNAVKDLIRHPTPLSWLGLILCLTVPCAMWIYSNREYLIPAHRNLLLAACVTAAISSVFGSVPEPRTYIPAIIPMIFVAVWLEARCNALRSTRSLAPG